MARLDQTVGTADYNDIFAAATPTAHVTTVKVQGNQVDGDNETLHRGTVLVGTPGGTLKPIEGAVGITASGTGTVTVAAPTVVVLAEDVDVVKDTDSVAHAYKTGNFRFEALLTDPDYTLTAADLDYMRTHGILVSDSL